MLAQTWVSQDIYYMKVIWRQCVVVHPELITAL